MLARFHHRLAWLLLAPYWIALAVATHKPPGAPKSIYRYDKLLHFGAFAVLTFLLAWSLPPRWRTPLAYAVVLLGAVLYGAADEITQGLVKGRSPDVWDWLADLCGACAGLFLFFLAAAIVIRILPQPLERRPSNAAEK